MKECSTPWAFAKLVYCSRLRWLMVTNRLLVFVWSPKCWWMHPYGKALRRLSIHRATASLKSGFDQTMKGWVWFLPPWCVLSLLSIKYKDWAKLEIWPAYNDSWLAITIQLICTLLVCFWFLSIGQMITAQVSSLLAMISNQVIDSFLLSEDCNWFHYL